MSDSLASTLGVRDPADPTAPVSPAPKLAVKAFCRAILASPQYRESLMRRILMDDLPSNIEHMLWDRAEGKVAEKVEVKDTTTPLTQLSVDALEQRHAKLGALLTQLRQQVAVNTKPDDSGASIH